MVNIDMNLISEVQSVTSHPDGSEVQVKVVGPKRVPQVMKATRARTRALLAEGPLDSATDTLEDALFDQDLHRLTAIRGKPAVRTEKEFLRDVTPGELLDDFDIGELEGRLYTVIVRED